MTKARNAHAVHGIAMALACLCGGLAGSAVAHQPPPGQRPPHGPPPSAIQACRGANEGDPCDFTGRFNERLVGTCVNLPDGNFACFPDQPPPPPPGEQSDTER